MGARRGRLDQQPQRLAARRRDGAVGRGELGEINEPGVDGARRGDGGVERRAADMERRADPVGQRAIEELLLRQPLGEQGFVGRDAVRRRDLAGAHQGLGRRAIGDEEGEFARRRRPRQGRPPLEVL